MIRKLTRRQWETFKVEKFKDIDEIKKRGYTQPTIAQIGENWTIFIQTGFLWKRQIEMDEEEAKKYIDVENPEQK